MTVQYQIENPLWKVGLTRRYNQLLESLSHLHKPLRPVHNLKWLK